MLALRIDAGARSRFAKRETSFVVSEFGQQLPRGQFGPILRGGRVRRRRGPDWRRIGLVVGIATLVLMIGIVGTGLALIWYGNRAITRVDVEGIADPAEWPPGMEPLTDVLNVLVVGNDSREGLSDEQLLRLGTEDHGGLLTDTIMLVQIDPNREIVSVLSFPRDLFVTRCDGSRGRINAAYSIGERSGAGGASCLVQTVTDFTGVPIHHFVQVNFAGFVDVVDTVGGVTIYLEEPLRDRPAGLDLPAGCVELDGIRALGFVRARHLDNDFGRIARQQRFVRELMNEVTSAGTLLNIPRLFSLVDAVGRAMETDQDLSLGDMRRIAFSLRNITPQRLDTRTVPSAGRRIDGGSYVVAKEEEAEALFQAFREGTIAPEGLGTSPPGQLTIADVPPLHILNGVGVVGLAAAAQEIMTMRGFEVAETGNAPNFDYQETLVVYPPERLEEAELVARQLPSAGLVESGELTDVTIILGRDFEPDAIAATPAAAPTGSPSPEPTETFAGAEPAEVQC